MAAKNQIFFSREVGPFLAVFVVTKTAFISHENQVILGSAGDIFSRVTDYQNRHFKPHYNACLTPAKCSLSLNLTRARQERHLEIEPKETQSRNLTSP